MSLYLFILVMPCNSWESLSLRHPLSSFSLSHLHPSTNIAYTSNHFRIKHQCLMKPSSSSSWRDWSWSPILAKLPFPRTSSAINNFADTDKSIGTEKPRRSESLLLKKPYLHVRHSLFQSMSSVLRGISAATASFLLFGRSQISHASGGFISSGSNSALRNSMSPMQVLILWGGLFLISALMHAAESAITKLSVWQLQELAESDGVKVIYFVFTFGFSDLT